MGTHATLDRAWPRPSVLVVDDGSAVGAALVLLLRAFGHHVGHVRVGGLQAALADPVPGVVLIDALVTADDLERCVDHVRRHHPATRTVVLAPHCHGKLPELVAQGRVDGWVSYYDEPEVLSRALAGETGGVQSPTVPARNTFSQLTARELDVLQALVSGSSSTHIALALGVSTHTVRTHVQNLFAKLDVHSRLEAVAVALDAGLRPTVLTQEMAG